MTRINVRFGRNLDNTDISIERFHGPRFHRWLPDGENDAIEIDSKFSEGKIKVWFERRGYVSRGSIEYDRKRHEVDSDIMSTQGLLEGGSLHGKLDFLDITDDELKVLNEKKIGDETYINLGRKIIKIIDQPIYNFFYVLRVFFGQYWIPEFDKWNSKEESVDNHLRFLWLEWSKDGGTSWEEFKPDNTVLSATAYLSSAKSFLNLITKTDWESLKDILKKDYDESLAAITLLRTHQYLEEGDIRHAFFEGVTAIELALREFFKSRLENNKTLEDYMKGFWSMSVPSQLISVASSLKLSNDDIENTLTAITWRNKIIHEGWKPDRFEARKMLRSLLRTTSNLLEGPIFKFPDAGGNSIMPDEKWTEEYNK